MKTKAQSIFFVLLGFASLAGLAGCPEVQIDPCAGVTCEVTETCQMGECVPLPDPCEGVTCNDDSNCTSDGCLDGLCVFTSICNGDDCVNGECVDLCESVECDDGDSCTNDSCESGMCFHEALTCNGTEVCVNGECIDDLCMAGNLCDDGNPCTTDCFEIITGSCTNVDMNCGDLDCDNGECIDLCDGVVCDDGDACTIDSCLHGECSNEAITCDEQFACVDGLCVLIPGNPTAGESFYSTNNCANCHSTAGLVSSTAAKIFAKLSGGESHDGGVFEGVTEQDSRDIESWFASITAGELFYSTNNCANCHSTAGLVSSTAVKIFAKLSGGESHDGGIFVGVTEQDSRDIEAWIASIQ